MHPVLVAVATYLAVGCRPHQAYSIPYLGLDADRKEFAADRRDTAADRNSGILR